MRVSRVLAVQHFSLVLMRFIAYFIMNIITTPAIIDAKIGIWIEIIMNYRSTTMTGKRFTYEANLSNIANLWETICWGPWIAASSQYSLICSAIFLHKLIILIMITSKRETIRLELKFHVHVYLLRKPNVNWNHSYYGADRRGKGPFLIIPGLNLGMGQVNFSLLQEALFHLFRNR